LFDVNTDILVLWHSIPLPSIIGIFARRLIQD